MVFEAGGLSASEKILLAAYCNHTDAHGYCWPGVSRLADETGMSERTVQRTNALLRKKQLIKSVHRINPKTGEQITNLTRVNLALLASLKRPPKDYGDNLIDEITFGDGDEDAFLPVERGRQSVTPPGVNLSPPPRQSVAPRGDTVTPKTAQEPSVETSVEPSPPAVGEVQVPTRAREAAYAAGDRDSRVKSGPTRKRPQGAAPTAASRLYRRLPKALRARVPDHGSRRVLEALEWELAHRSEAELAERIERRAARWEYRAGEARDATAVAITIVRRGYDCPDLRCEDHVRLDTGKPCEHCAETATSRRPASPAPRPCPNHPGAVRRADGECAGCWVDRVAAATDVA